MELLQLSVLNTGRLYPPGDIPGTHLYEMLSRPKGHSVAERMKIMKISITPLGIEPATYPF
jgi:hypothetical protein